MPGRWLVLALCLVSACTGPSEAETATSPTSVTINSREPTSTTLITTTTTLIRTKTMPTTTTTVGPFARPVWLGTRPLPLRADEHGEVQPTPPELQDRRLETIDYLEPPTTPGFSASVGPVPPDVLARSSWADECPVTVEELSYLRMVHIGFDRELHTGEMIVNAVVAEDVVEVFRRIFESGFPIEQMRVITAEEIDAHPTGDWNDTTSFVCRPAVGSSSWSQHAYGLAIDVNPFHNPYLKGDLVLPELSSAYLDREDVRPGMIREGDVVTLAFADIGWRWGGNWSTLKDWMHFSRSGR